jgi:hypothetical protein
MSTQTVYSFLVGPYARQIYLDGTKTMASLTAEYVQPVKEYAAKNFTYAQIDDALAAGRIDQQTYNDTIALKALIEPRPAAVAEEPTL